MADIPPEAVKAGAEAVNEAHAKRGWNKPAPWWSEEVATAVLDAAAPLLAEAWGEPMRWLIEARYEVIAGSRKADGAEGFFAALEHLDLYEPEEFYGDTIPEAIRRAYAWAVAKESAAPVTPEGKDEDHDR